MFAGFQRTVNSRMIMLFGCLIICALLAATTGCSSPPAEKASPVTPVPSVQGPITVTKDSVPFARAWNIDLGKAGYVEEEFMMSGQANVYDFDNTNKVIVRTPNAPYTTRLLVRRPANPEKFSGNVIVEIINMSRGWDLDVLWQMVHEHILRTGDAYVGITSKPNAVRAMKKFDPVRYAPLTWANPLPLSDPRNCEKVAADSARDTENGLLWDIFSQTGALLKSESPKKPLAGYRIQQVYLTGYSQSAGMLRTYINFIHPMARLGNGKPVYDGYLVGASGGMAPINQCATAVKAGDPRFLIMPRDVPVITVMTNTDFLGGYAARRPDSDAPGDRYRLYEIAGASHGYTFPASFEPQIEDLQKSGFTNRFTPGNCPPPKVTNDFPSHIIYHVALVHLDRWVRNGTPPPHAPLISITKPGTPEAAPELDQFGNAIGGVRTPYVDVPTATYYPLRATPRTPGNGECEMTKAPFDHAKLKSLYPTHADYVAKVTRDADRLVAEGWLLPADADQIKTEAAAAKVP
jgi:hypothetical protein